MSAADPASELARSADLSAATRLRRWRRLKDRVAAALMGVGGWGVLAAILLIFFYLLYVVAPLFAPAGMKPASPLYGSAAGTGASAFVALEEYGEIGLRVLDSGEAIFFEADTGRPLEKVALTDTPPAAIAQGDLAQRSFALARGDGTVLLLTHEYDISYPGSDSDVARRITPRLAWPLGEQPLPLAEQGGRVSRLAAQYDGDAAVVAGLAEGGGLVHLARFDREQSFLTGETSVERTGGTLPVDADIVDIALSKDLSSLYLVSAGGEIHYYDVSDVRQPVERDRAQAAGEGARITALRFLAGGISLLVGDSRGRVTQWFPVRDESNDYTLERIREFRALAAPVTAIMPEHYRKGFAAGAADGSLAIYHTTAHQRVLERSITDAAITGGTFGPRPEHLILDTREGTQRWRVSNAHPEISWRALWGKVWYESRSEPELIWQSSSASSDFEPKFSLTPLAFGTFKAAFYAMLFAVPLAIAGAVYTAYFMSARLRGAVKPTIEIMEALPTVILGFLAGLWLAPLVEEHLPAVLGSVVLVPLAVLAAAALWPLVPAALRHRVPPGWEGALLMPVIAATVLLAFAASPSIELALFDGDMPNWLSRELGISYDQRNSLVVGMAMGFAVIPTIFSISEDAVFSVPRHLTSGSLALGATPWQTLTRVVILTASPGIFSAVMIGMGRAVGETMIVLMATGNTPIMDINIFQGFRALSANIAVEMPESEVGSTHYRVLFLAGLVLFLATFLFNTVAELVRQRLRRKYSSM